MENAATHAGAETRERLLAIAEEAVLAKGFGATSIEELTAAASITKNGFFYHFPDKNALALALLKRYVERDDALLDDVFTRGTSCRRTRCRRFLSGSSC